MAGGGSDEIFNKERRKMKMEIMVEGKIGNLIKKTSGNGIF